MNKRIEKTERLKMARTKTMKPYKSTQFVSRLCLSLILCFCAGCLSGTHEEVLQDWVEDGWTQVASHGETGEITRHAVLQSKQAKSIEASWVERGRRKTKVYSQRSHFHVILRFFKEDGDQFAVVMKKRK
jgi:hypothetical protein